ncbi:hypothetical protein [Rhodococcus sp. NPDC004095]
MSRSTRSAATALIAMALTLTFAGCSSDDDATPAENTAAACDAYTAFVGSVAEAQTELNSSPTIGEIAETRGAVGNAYAELTSAVDAVGEDRLDALTDAWENYDAAVSGLDPNLTVPQAARQLSGDIDAIIAAQQNLGASLGC